MKKKLFLLIFAFGIYNFLLSANIDLKLKKSIKLNSNIVVISDIIIVNDKIFILDKISKEFAILSLNGNIKKNMLKQGKGFGETSSPISIFGANKEKCIGISDIGNRKILYFNYDGVFVNEKKYQTMNTMVKMDYINDNCSIEFWKNIDFSKGKMSLNPVIKLVTPSNEKILFSKKFNMLEFDFKKLISPIYAYRNNYICITEKSQNKYNIAVYDTTSKVVCKISKKIKSRIKKKKKEIEEIKQSFANTGKKIKNFQYKNIIDNILISEKNNIWVLVNNKFGNSFEIYNMNGDKLSGIFNKKKKFGNCVLFQDKLYEISGNEDEGYVFNIYSIIYH
jgi:hypothetical protein